MTTPSSDCGTMPCGSSQGDSSRSNGPHSTRIEPGSSRAAARARASSSRKLRRRGAAASRPADQVTCRSSDVGPVAASAAWRSRRSTTPGVAPKSLSSQRPASGVRAKNRSSTSCQTVSNPSTLVRTRTSALRRSAAGGGSSRISRSPEATTPDVDRARRDAGRREIDRSGSAWRQTSSRRRGRRETVRRTAGRRCRRVTAAGSGTGRRAAAKRAVPGRRAASRPPASTACAPVCNGARARQAAAVQQAGVLEMGHHRQQRVQAGGRLVGAGAPGARSAGSAWRRTWGKPACASPAAPRARSVCRARAPCESRRGWQCGVGDAGQPRRQRRSRCVSVADGARRRR